MRALALLMSFAACSSSAPGDDVDVPVVTEVVEADVGVDASADADAPEVAAEPEVVVEVPWPRGCVLGDGDLVPVPEASGAAFMDDGRVLVVADSGNEGRAIFIDLASGASTSVSMPLGGGGDDVEDLARAPDGTIWGLTSAGWLLGWKVASEIELVRGPTPVADEGEWRCAHDGVNCAANFEGFCLHPAPPADGCVGWAASKAKGVLVCVVPSDGAYRIDPATTITVAAPDQLSGCAYEPVAPYRLLVAGNLNTDSKLWQVDVATGEATLFEARGAGNQEALLVTADGLVHSFGDLQEILPDASPHQVMVCSHTRAALPSPR